MAKILVLRKCAKDLTSYNRFQYPKKGLVEAPDWNSKPQCGGGLHALPWGAGDASVVQGVLWQIIEVDDSPDNYVAFEAKCKFQKGKVLLTTDSQVEAITKLKSHRDYPTDNILNFDVTDKQFAVSGYRSTQTAGYVSTQTAGYGSTQTAGYRSTQTAGYVSTQTAGNGSTQKAGLDSVQIGYWYDTAGYHVAVRIVGEAEANKPYRFDKGTWTEVKGE